jgi:hypothetical protein
VLDRVNAAAPRGRMGRHQLATLTPTVATVLRGGVWTSPALAEHLAANLAGIKSAYSVTRYRLADLPDAPLGAPARPTRPPWCGTCDERTRMRENTEGAPYRCPACHPLTGVQRGREKTAAVPARGNLPRQPNGAQRPGPGSLSAEPTGTTDAGSRSESLLLPGRARRAAPRLDSDRRCAGK